MMGLLPPTFTIWRTPPWHSLRPRHAPNARRGCAPPALGLLCWAVYALAILRYRRPLEEVLKVVDEHRAYLRTLKERGLLLASGPFEPRSGGALLLRVPEGVDLWLTLDRVRDDDPFVKAGLVQYEVLPWSPIIGQSDLDK